LFKRFLVITLVLFIFGYFYSCKSKKKVETIPKPEEKQEEKVEEVKEEVPKLKTEELSEEEIFKNKTIQELNEEGILEMVFFDFDKAEIKDSMKPVLEKNASWLKKHPSVKILIEGHCDERGTVEYNLALGERRAKAAQEYLVSLGIESSRIKTISYGKSRPLDPRHTKEAWDKNRRAEFRIISK